MMKTHALAVAALAILASAGCVTRTHEEQAARRSTWPTSVDRSPAAGRSDADWPSVEGDVLHGTSPAELAAARAAVSQPLIEALGKP